MTPSNDLINWWLLIAEASEQPRFLTFATLAAEWGAKQEREACAKYLDDCNEWDLAEVIRSRGEVKP